MQSQVLPCLATYSTTDHHRSLPRNILPLNLLRLPAPSQRPDGFALHFRTCTRTLQPHDRFETDFTSSSVSTPPTLDTVRFVLRNIPSSRPSLSHRVL